MPKVRRERTKYHAPAPRNASAEESTSPPVDDDSLSSKKDKRKQRRDEWLRKLGAIHSQQQRQIEAEKRAKTVVIGDMMPLTEALEEVQALATEKRPVPQPAQPVKTKTRKHRQRELKAESERFQQVLSLPAFKKDALGALCEHLKFSETNTT